MQVRSPYITFISAILLILSSTFASAANYADFAKDWQYHEAKISPDGKHIGLVLVHDGKRRLAIVDSKTFKPVGGADFGERQQVGAFYWATDERLIIEIAHHLPWQEQPINAGELFAVDYDGGRGKIIYGFRAGDRQIGSNIKKSESTRGFGEIVSLLPDDENNILISSRPWSRDGSSVPTVHKLNINSGRMSGVKIGGPSPLAQFFTVDDEVRIAVGLNKNDEKTAFILDENDEWQALTDEQFGSGFYPLGIDKSSENLLVVDNLGQDKTGVFEVNLKTGKRKNRYTDDKADIAAAIFESDRSGVYAVRLETDYPNYVVLDTSSAEAALFKELLNTFKGYRISVTSRSKDNNLWLIHASNDTTVGSYYLFNKKSNQFSLLFNNFSHVPQQEMSQSIPITFPASDGEQIHGFITYPAGVPETQNVPLVTLVHGGPHLRDYWAYDSEVQMLASQGYAVLRVNFRGSSGYGKRYKHAGYKQWGGRIQQDVIDGTKWVIAQGGIDQDKVCIMGTSFGGYSALQSSILAPELYKCAVANAGVYDLPNMFEDGDVPDFLFGESYLERTLGNDMEQLKKFSPTYNLEKLKAPVFIAHGEKDRRAPFKQAKQLKEKLEAMGKPYEWFALATETHGFHDEGNRMAYFEKVTGFLAKHLK